MNRIVLGAFTAIVLLGVGLFWLEGRAEVERGAPPPEPQSAQLADSNTLPEADIAGLEGPKPPEATELTREQRRFFRYDADRDWKITRNEMLATRTDSFRKLDTDGNNLLTFEEWAITTSQRFEEMDADSDLELTPAEFATSAPKQRAKSSCRC